MRVHSFFRAKILDGASMLFMDVFLGLDLMAFILLSCRMMLSDSQTYIIHNGISVV